MGIAILKGDALRQRLEEAGYTQVEIANHPLLRVTPGAVWQWIEYGIPPKRVMRFIGATQRCGFTAHELRPDVFPEAA